MIDDGWGDETPEQTALRFLHWSHWHAGQLVPATDALYDDLVQEALITAWRTAEEKGIRNAVYVTTAARYRQQGVAAGRPMTGGDSTPGPKSRPAEQRVDTYDDLDPALLAAPELLDTVEWAYHRGEILAVLDGMDPRHRRYVWAKFFEGKRDFEIAAEMAVDKRLLNTWWRRTIRPRLAAELEHLVVT